MTNMAMMRAGREPWLCSSLNLTACNNSRDGGMGVRKVEREGVSKEGREGGIIKEGREEERKGGKKTSILPDFKYQ